MKYVRTHRTPEDFAWTQWSVADIKKNTQMYIDNLRKNIDTLLAIPKKERTFENTYWALETIDYPYHNHGHFLGILTNTSPRASIRDAAREAETLIHEQSLALLHRPEVYHAVCACKVDMKSLTPELAKLVRDTNKGFQRSGFTLPEGEFKRLQKNMKRIHALGQDFDKNIAEYDATLAVPVALAGQLGLPSSYLATLPKKKGMYHIGATPAQYGPFMSYCNHALWRKKMSAVVNKKGGRKNLKNLSHTLQLREDNARLLGFDTHAAYVLAERMAKTPARVASFHRSIHSAITSVAHKDLALLQQAKHQHTGNDQLDPWDIGYYSRTAQEERFALDPEEVRKYFSLEKVLGTLFRSAERLFGIVIEEALWNTWHPDVRTFVLRKGKEVMGYIAMDLHPRSGKYTHAMAHNVYDAGIYQWGSTTYETPITAIVANFRGPTKKSPSLLSFDEVTTLFHEFGHALHNTLTTAWIPSQAGFNTVWDFVELPSQIFEEWAWVPSVITDMSAHVQTGEPMPRAMMQNLIGSRAFLEGLFLTRQIAMGSFDMEIHQERPTTSLPDTFMKIARTYSPLPQSKDSLFPASFAHIMHGYDAGYYSYLWSRVYAYECFNLFTQRGIMSATVGKQYWLEILSRGSSRDEMESLQAFLGKAPSVKAFINHIVNAAQYE